jgi:hypothetical protein
MTFLSVEFRVFLGLVSGQLVGVTRTATKDRYKIQDVVLTLLSTKTGAASVPQNFSADHESGGGEKL